MLSTAVSSATVKAKFKNAGIGQGLNSRLPDETGRSRVMTVGAILPSGLSMRLPRGYETAGAFSIITRAILSEIFAISQVLFLRF